MLSVSDILDRGERMLRIRRIAVLLSSTLILLLLSTGCYRTLYNYVSLPKSIGALDSGRVEFQLVRDYGYSYLDSLLPLSINSGSKTAYYSYYSLGLFFFDSLMDRSRHIEPRASSIDIKYYSDFSDIEIQVSQGLRYTYQGSDYNYSFLGPIIIPNDYRGKVYIDFDLELIDQVSNAVLDSFQISLTCFREGKRSWLVEELIKGI